MNGSAAITGNSAGNGGGVYVYNGTFTMNGGAIAGNAVTSTSYGGGVYVYNGTFTKTVGVIYGGDDNYHGDTDTENTARSGNGHALYVYDSGNSYPRKNGDIGVAQNISISYVAGTWVYTTPVLGDPFWD
jgi:hypothetical protein